MEIPPDLYLDQHPSEVVFCAAGAKKGTASDRNPVRLYWPDLITAPIDGQQSPDLLDWDGERGLCRIWQHRLASEPSSFCQTRHATQAPKVDPACRHCPVALFIYRQKGCGPSSHAIGI